MAGRDPAATVNQLMDAINQQNVEAALALYEPEAVLLAEPGKPARGTAAIRTALQGFIALHPTLTGATQHVIEQGELAQYASAWSLKGTTPDGRPVQMGGTSSDVLRRHADGTWLIVIDNPWGTGQPKGM